MATMIKFICPVCENDSEKYIGHYNRSKSIGAPVYCSRTCAGIGRRTSAEKKKAVKAGQLELKNMLEPLMGEADQTISTILTPSDN